MISGISASAIHHVGQKQSHQAEKAEKAEKTLGKAEACADRVSGECLAFWAFWAFWPGLRIIRTERGL
jgi:hypothetical protein